MLNTNFLNNQNYIGNKKEKNFVGNLFIESLIFQYHIFGMFIMLGLFFILLYFVTNISDNFLLNFLNKKLLDTFYLDPSSLKILDSVSSHSFRSGLLYETLYIFVGAIIVIYIFIYIKYRYFIKNKYNSHIGKYIVYNKTYKSYVNSIMWNYLVVEKNNTKYYYSPYSFTINKEIKLDNIIADNGAYIIKLKKNHE